jgi:hypothetical protein
MATEATATEPDTTPAETTATESAGETLLTKGESSASLGKAGKESQKAPEAKPVVPEKYDLKLPEKSHLDAAAVEAFSGYARKNGLSNEQAQAILDREHEAVTSFSVRQLEQANAEVKSWADKVRSDSELGGESFSKNIDLAKRVIDRFGSPELRKALSDTGLGNHPELVRMVVRIAKTMSDDTLILKGVKPTKTAKSAEELFYGAGANESGDGKAA